MDTESVLAKNLGESFGIDVDYFYQKIELALMLMLLAGLPFSYFYALEVQESEQMDLFSGNDGNDDLEGESLLEESDSLGLKNFDSDEEKTVAGDSLFNALMQTGKICIPVALVVGLFSMLPEARELGLAVTKLIGMILSSVYLAYGMAALPIYLMKTSD